jgi:hypothetical protein
MPEAAGYRVKSVDAAGRIPEREPDLRDTQRGGHCG